MNQIQNHQKGRTSEELESEPTIMSQGEHSPAVCCRCPRSNCTCHPLAVFSFLMKLVGAKKDFDEGLQIIETIKQERAADPSKYPTLNLEEKEEELDGMVRRNKEQMLDLLLKQKVEEDSIQRFMAEPKNDDICKLLATKRL
jgi:hypothetical protein